MSYFVCQWTVAFVTIFTHININEAVHQHGNAATSASSPIVPQYVSDYLQTASGGTLNVSQRYCEWNVSAILMAINQTDPSFLLSDSTKALLPQLLPQFVLNQFPAALRSQYGLPAVSAPMAAADCLRDFEAAGGVPTFDMCKGPLIHSNRKNTVNENAKNRPIPVPTPTGTLIVNVTLKHCGLACSAAPVVNGLTDNEQDFIDTFKIVGCSFCFVCVVWLVINLYYDQKNSGKKFTEKPILQTLPYLLTLSLFTMVFMMAVSEMSGKEAIVCHKHFDHAAYPNDDPREATVFNPAHGESAACTIAGLIFYSSLMFYAIYTTLLCFCLFRYFYAPLAPLWGIRQRWWHLGVVAMVLFADIWCTAASRFAGVYPMGVCLPQPTRYTFTIPFTVLASFSFVCLCASAWVLRQKVSVTSSGKSGGKQDKIQELLTRLMWYGVVVLAGLWLDTATGWVFRIQNDALSKSFNKFIECRLNQEVFGRDLDVDCYAARDTKTHPFWFVSWVIAAILCCTAQIILACNQEARQRLKRVSQYTSKMGSKMIATGSKMGSPSHPSRTSL